MYDDFWGFEIYPEEEDEITEDVPKKNYIEKLCKAEGYLERYRREENNKNGRNGR